MILHRQQQIVKWSHNIWPEGPIYSIRMKKIPGRNIGNNFEAHLKFQSDRLKVDDSNQAILQRIRLNDYRTPAKEH